MELVLERNELAQLGTVSFCDTMKLVAGSSKTNRQRARAGATLSSAIENTERGNSASLRKEKKQQLYVMDPNRKTA